MQDQLRMMQALGSLMKNKDALRDAGERVKHRLATERVDAEVAGVRVTCTCPVEITRVDAEPGALAGDDAGLVITHATNAALTRARERAKTIAQEELAALNIPGLEDLLRSNGAGVDDMPGMGGMGGLGGLLG